MASSSLDLSGSDKPRQIQENMMMYMRLFASLSGIHMDDAETFWLVSNKSAPGNGILRTRFEAARAEERIDALLDQIGKYIDHIDWFVFPDDKPFDLGKRLESRGMPGGPGGNWLWIDLTSSVVDPVVPDHFHIEQVRDDQMLEEWVHVSEAGLGSKLEIFYEAYARHGYGADAFSLHYIGYLRDMPVTAGTLLDAGGSASIYDISTPPAFRHQGFASAITHYLMKEIRNRGYADTWIWSSNMAKGVYQKLGYVDADFGLREYSWYRRS